MFIGGGARARRRARQGARPPRLQARQRDGRPRRPGARHGLRPRAPGAARSGDGAAPATPAGADVDAKPPLGDRGSRARRRRPMRPTRRRTLVIAQASRRRVRSRSRPGSVDMFDAQLTRTGRDDGHAGVHGARAVPGRRRPTRAPISSASASRSTRRSTASARSTATRCRADGERRAGERHARRPPSSNVPLWLRKVLLRGLRPTPTERFPSMAELLAGAGEEPGRRSGASWRAAAGGAAGGRRSASACARALADHRVDLRRRPGAARRRLGAEPAPGEPSRRGKRSSARRSCATGKSYATDVFASVSRALTAYAQSWARHVPRGLRGDRGARRAVRRGARPADGVPAGAARRAARAHATSSARPTARSSRTRSAPSNALGHARSLRRRRRCCARSCGRPRIRRRARASRSCATAWPI